ncbi:MAG: hypothetical protein U7M05_12250 [Candidatus Igneacidithiobacillus chanchocoensis]
MRLTKQKKANQRKEDLRGLLQGLLGPVLPAIFFPLGIARRHIQRPDDRLLLFIALAMLAFGLADFVSPLFGLLAIYLALVAAVSATSEDRL